MTREDAIKGMIRDEVRRLASELHGYQVLLFGSRAAGKHRERSDFDIGILGNKPIKTETFYTLDDLLEKIDTLYQIDFVDLNRTGPSFQKEALKCVELLYDGN